MKSFWVSWPLCVTSPAISMLWTCIFRGRDTSSQTCILQWGLSKLNCAWGRIKESLGHFPCCLIMKTLISAMLPYVDSLTCDLPTLTSRNPGFNWTTKQAKTCLGLYEQIHFILRKIFSININVGPQLCPTLKFCPTVYLSLTPLSLLCTTDLKLKSCLHPIAVATCNLINTYHSYQLLLLISPGSSCLIK